MTTVDVFIQRLAAVIYWLETEVVDDEVDQRLLQHWLKLYRMQRPSLDVMDRDGSST